MMLNPTEKLLALSNTSMQDKSVEEAEKGFRGRFCCCFCFFLLVSEFKHVSSDCVLLSLQQHSSLLEIKGFNTCRYRFPFSCEKSSETCSKLLIRYRSFVLQDNTRLTHVHCSRTPRVNALYMYVKGYKSDSNYLFVNREFERNDDGEAVYNVALKMNLYFTYEFRNTLKSFSLFLTVKTTSKLNVEHSVKLQIEI